MKYYLILGLLWMVGCHEANKNKISPAELVKSREIKKVSEAEILAAASNLGDEIFKELEVILLRHLSTDSIVCDQSGWTDFDSLESKYETRISWVHRSTPDLSEVALQLLEAYAYNNENQIAPRSSVQKLDSKWVLYSFPVHSESALYRYCKDSAQVEPGMWRLKIPVKYIISQL